MHILFVFRNAYSALGVKYKYTVETAGKGLLHLRKIIQDIVLNCSLKLYPVYILISAAAPLCMTGRKIYHARCPGFHLFSAGTSAVTAFPSGWLTAEYTSSCQIAAHSSKIASVQTH